MAIPCSPPQTTKDQSAPCHSPEAKKITRVLTQVRGSPRRLRRRAVQVGEHPLLLDGVDTVDQAALGIADFEYPAFELQDLLRIALPVRGVFAQLLPGAFHGIDDRIFAHLQLRILAQKRHILLVAFEPRDAGFD